MPRLLIALLGLVLPSALALPQVPTRAADAPNVLLIAIDDMNDWVGCLGGHPDAVSPHIDRLAARGTLFRNAHCQAPICNPSRTSIMYGMRPSSSGVYMNSPRPWTVKKMRERTTLARHFAANGYRTYTTGKIYHGSGLPADDFEVVGPRPGQRHELDKRLVPQTKDGAKGLWDFGGQTFEEGLMQDHADATWAIEQLAGHETDRPFFMAIGFYRPHVPFYSPIRVFDETGRDGVTLPKVKEGDRDDLPPIVDAVTRAAAAPPHQWFVKTGRWIEAVQAYLACIRWTDEQVGRLIDALDASPHAKNTIVILYSDHGFFLGEKERWAKQSLWERATHVPFIIDAPGLPDGAICDRPVELLSIYPTLVDLCQHHTHHPLEGRSLVSLLHDAKAEWPYPALTTHGRNNHAVRTETHRYIRYSDGSEELYDLRSDPNEWTNLASDSGNDELKKSLSAFFPSVNVAAAKATQNPRPKKSK